MILTVTLAPKAECPKENPNLQLTFQLPRKTEQIPVHDIEIIKSIQDFLNEGGATSSVINELQQENWAYEYIDVTNDDLKDLIVESNTYIHQIHIFLCNVDKYLEFSDNTIGSENYHLIEIKDLNTNGIPEILIRGGSFSSSGLDLIILEWDGNSFTNIGYYKEKNEWPGIYFGSNRFKIKDIDKEGPFELILRGNVVSEWYYMDYYRGAPWRIEIDTYSWNGKVFAKQPIEYMTPEYRYQAIQDGDRYTLAGNYKDAISSYQEAIFSDKLEWFSPERKHYIETLGGVYGKDITPQPSSLDATEYPRIAAYAYFRIMLLHIVQGYESDAGTVYSTLQQKFGNDPYGRPYVEMATTFWDAYQSSKKMYDGCAAAIQYAAEHPDILIPLGSDYHGWQSHSYVPVDVCPFR